VQGGSGQGRWAADVRALPRPPKPGLQVLRKQTCPFCRQPGKGGGSQERGHMDAVCPGPPLPQMTGDSPLLPCLVPAQRPTLQDPLGHPHHQHPPVFGGACSSPGTVERDVGCDGGGLCSPTAPTTPQRHGHLGAGAEGATRAGCKYTVGEGSVPLRRPALAPTRLC